MTSPEFDPALADDAQRGAITPDDSDYVPSGSYLDRLHGALEAHDRTALIAFFDQLHVADIADIIEQADGDERREIIRLWGVDIDPLVLIELEDGVRSEILDHIPYDVLTRGLSELESDELVYLVEDLEQDKRARLLGALDRSDREAVSQSLTYPEGSAGRLMQRNLVLAPEHWSVGDAIDFMRASSDLPDYFHNVFVVTPALKPIGVVHLSAIMASLRKRPITELIGEDIRVFDVETPQEDVAYAFSQYHMLSAPVVDLDGRIVGEISVEDALEILDEEADEDIKRLAGLGDEELTDNFWDTARLRFPWLAVNLVTCIFASLVISVFEETIAAVVALAVLMPIVASMGGNAGTQTLTVAVRALATRDLTRANAMRIITRELWVGLANGMAFAVIIGVIGYVWFSSYALGLVLAAAMIINLVVAGLAGILIPICLDKLGADPALASGAFVTTVTDIVGFFVFLGLAAMFLI